MPEETTLKEYLKTQKKIFKELLIWGKITPEERQRLDACTTKSQVSNIALDLIKKYL